MNESKKNNETATIGNTVLGDVFSLFVADDDLRPVMNKPFEKDGFIVATNVHSLVKIDKKFCKDFETKNDYESLKISHLFHEYNQNEIIKISISDLEEFRTEKKLKEVGKDVRCSECDGDGEVEWGYSTWLKFFDCPKCDGSGLQEESSYIETGELKFANNALIKIKGIYFSANQFYKVLQVSKLTGTEACLKFIEDRKAGVFEVGNFTILLMPYVVKDEDSERVLVNIA